MTTGSADRCFAGDRYERLTQAAVVLAADPLVIDTAALAEFIGTLVERRLLDHVGERDADVASALLLVDYPGGAERMAWRIYDCLRADRRAVASVLTAALAVALELAPVQPSPQRLH